MPDEKKESGVLENPLNEPALPAEVTGKDGPGSPVLIGHEDRADQPEFATREKWN